MGRGHGSTGTSTWRGSSSNPTMRGYSSPLAQAVSAIESAIKGDTDAEHAYIFNDNGQTIYADDAYKTAHPLMKKIMARSTIIPQDKAVNNIVTHNHPSGDSLSSLDLKTAIGYNVKEIRATGKKYTFSLKRPQKGWNVSVKAVTDAYNAAKANFKSSSYPQHETLKKVASQFGFDYSWSENR